VLFMTIPGLSLFYAGLVRRKHMLSVLMQCFMTTCVMSILWTVCGYSLSFSTAGPGTLAPFVGGLDKAFLNGVTDASLVDTIPEALWFVFQMTFAIITPGLMIGAFVERIKLSAAMLFMVVWEVVVYFPICHMVWAGAGAYFADMGVLDFAGGIVVHVTAGISALVACIMLGPRKENSMVAHNLPLSVMGTGMLWVGWYGFNAGSAAAAGAGAAMAMVVTQVAAATGALTWTLQDYLETKRTSVIGIITGSIAGLAAITPCSGFVGVKAALAIGVISGVVCRVFSTSIKTYFGYDDSLDVFGVHGVGGFLGSILVGVFCSSVFGGNQGAIDIAAQVGVQTFAAVSTAIYSAVATWVILKAVDATVGLRAPAGAEAAGMDQYSFGEDAYVEEG